MIAPGETTFWQHLDLLVSQHDIRIDRPAGSVHPRYPDVIYPLDYGYLEGTRGADGHGIDLWCSPGCGQGAPVLTALVCTVDLVKSDNEIKLLLGCSDDDIATVLAFHRGGDAAALLIPRPAFV